MTDPRLTIKGLIEDGWTVEEIPRFTIDAVDEPLKEPHVVVSHIATTPAYIGFSDTLETDTRRFRSFYAVDVWSTDKDLRYRMVEGIDKILHAKCNNPGGGLEFMECSGWVPMDELSTHPRLFRSKMRIEVLYYG